MYFAVKTPMRIGNKSYLPCVSYEVTCSLEKTVEKLEGENKVYVSDVKMIFQSGKWINKEVKIEKKQSKKKAKKVTEVTAEPAVIDTANVDTEGF
jgi:hypothetical protein